MTTDLQQEVVDYSAYPAVSLNEEQQGGIGLPVLRFSGKSGAYTDVDREEVYATGVQVIPLLRIGSTRVMFPPNDESEENAAPECGSDDNIYPRDPEQAARINAGPMCGSCQFGQWEDDSEGGRKPPPCKEHVNYAVTLADDPAHTVLVLPCKGMSIRPMREAIQSVAKLAKRYNRPPFSFTLNLSAVPRGKGVRQYFELAADIGGEPVPADELPGIYVAYQEALQYVIPDRAELSRQQRAAVRVTGSGHTAIVEAQSRALPAGPQVELPLEERPALTDDKFDADGSLIRHGADGAVLPLITPAQLGTLESIAFERGIDSDALSGMATDRYGYVAAELTVLEANELLAVVKASKPKAAARRG